MSVCKKCRSQSSGPHITALMGGPSGRQKPYITPVMGGSLRTAMGGELRWSVHLPNDMSTVPAWVFVRQS